MIDYFSQHPTIIRAEVSEAQLDEVNCAKRLAQGFKS